MYKNCFLEQYARQVRRYGCVIGHHAPLPWAEAQGSDRAANRRYAVSAPRRHRRPRPKLQRHTRSSVARLRARNSTTGHGHGGRR